MSASIWDQHERTLNATITGNAAATEQQRVHQHISHASDALARRIAGLGRG